MALFSTVILIYIIGFVMRCLVAYYHSTKRYKDKAMRSGQTERHEYVPIQDSLTKSGVRIPVADQSSSDNDSAEEL